MKIYTSYFGKLNKIPSNILPIAICGKSPDWYTGVEYKKLAPKLKFFLEWKENKDNDFYIEHFNTEVLSCITADEVVKRLKTLMESNPGHDSVCLLCYEKPGDFCHRHLVADWLKSNGYECEELIYE